MKTFQLVSKSCAAMASLFLWVGCNSGPPAEGPADSGAATDRPSSMNPDKSVVLTINGATKQVQNIQFAFYGPTPQADMAFRPVGVSITGDTGDGYTLMMSIVNPAVGTFPCPSDQGAQIYLEGGVDDGRYGGNGATTQCQVQLTRYDGAPATHDVHAVGSFVADLQLYSGHSPVPTLHVTGGSFDLLEHP